MFSLILSRRQNVCFVSRPIEFATFPLKNGDHPKLVVDFLREKHIPKNKTVEIVEDFDEKKQQQQR